MLPSTWIDPFPMVEPSETIAALSSGRGVQDEDILQRLKEVPRAARTTDLCVIVGEDVGGGRTTKLYNTKSMPQKM
jgi:hypothetical protein